MKSIGITSKDCLCCANTAGDILVLVNESITVNNFDYIQARIGSIDYMVTDKGEPYYVYGVLYDESQLITGDLLEGDVKGLGCVCS